MDIEDPYTSSEILLKQKDVDEINERIYQINNIKKIICFTIILSFFAFFGMIIKQIL